MNAAILKLFEGQQVCVTAAGATRDLKFVGEFHLLDNETAQVIDEARGMVVVAVDKITAVTPRYEGTVRQ